MQSQIDCLLVMYRRLFQNVSLQDARHNTYHYLFLGCIRGAMVVEHYYYLALRSRFLIQPSRDPIGVGRLFLDLCRAVPNPPPGVRDAARPGSQPILVTSSTPESWNSSSSSGISAKFASSGVRS